MKRIGIIVMMVFFLISMAGGVYALDFGFLWNYGNPPIWKIFKNGKAVQWVDWVNDKRFAIYNSGTPNDPSDDMVLDKETGLVWERSPSTEELNLVEAQHLCNNLTLGNRKGWRLPTVQELASLVDPNAPSAPFLPAGHPFQNVQLGGYWSATTYADFTSEVWLVSFKLGYVANYGKSNDVFFWCVRGGQGVNPQ